MSIRQKKPEVKPKFEKWLFW